MSAMFDRLPTLCRVDCSAAKTQLTSGDEVDFNVAPKLYKSAQQWYQRVTEEDNKTRNNRYSQHVMS